mgnify:FL=1
MSRIFSLVLLLCIFFTCCSCSMNVTQNDNDPRESQEEDEFILTLNEENMYTFRDPRFHFSVSFPEKYSFFLYGYDSSYGSGNESPDSSVYIFLDFSHIFDFVNYIDVTGQHGHAVHAWDSLKEKRIDIINDAGQEATMYYYQNDKEEIVFEYTIKNGFQFVSGCFELDFFESNKETILAICKSVQDYY